MDFWHGYEIEFPVETAVCQELSSFMNCFGGLSVESVKVMIVFLLSSDVAMMKGGRSVVSVSSPTHPVSADA